MAFVNQSTSPTGSPLPDDGTPPSKGTSPSDGTPPSEGVPAAQVVGFSAAMAPLIDLAVEHGLDLLGRGQDLQPTVLAVTAQGMRGMWTEPDLTPEDAAGFVGRIEPRPARAVAVFDGGVQTDEGLTPAYFVESFEAGQDVSVRLVVPHDVGHAEEGIAPKALGEPTLVANGPNPLA